MTCIAPRLPPPVRLSCAFGRYTTPAVVQLPPAYLNVSVHVSLCQNSMFFHVPDVGAVKLRTPFPASEYGPQGRFALLLAAWSSVLKIVTPVSQRFAEPL